MFSAFKLLLSLLLAAPIAAHAIPDFNQKADFSALTRTNSSYRFQTLPFVSADGKRRYRVYLGIPKTPAPAEGFPVIYALDGNAVLAELTEPRLHELSLRRPTVLVLLGNDTDKRLAPDERAWDYTPPAPDGSAIAENGRNRSNGGADEFAELLLNQIRPAVNRTVSIHPKQQTLWGHSYGGLFVLHTLFHWPQAFQRYIAADPSFWWQNGQILQEAEQFAAARTAAPDALVLIHQSGRHDSPPPPQAVQNFGVADNRTAVAERNQAAARLLATNLNRLHMANGYRRFPDDNHGSLLGSSFQAALGWK